MNLIVPPDFRFCPFCVCICNSFVSASMSLVDIEKKGLAVFRRWGSWQRQKIDVAFYLEGWLGAWIFLGSAHPVFCPSGFLISERRALQLEVVSRQTPNTCSYFQISVNLVICSLRL